MQGRNDRGSRMPRFLGLGYCLGQFFDNTAIQLLPVVHDQELEPIRRVTGPADGGRLNDKRLGLIGQLQMKLDVVARIKRCFILDGAAIDRERGHEAHPSGYLRTQNDWIMHWHAVMEARILGNRATRRHTKGQYSADARAGYALFGGMFDTYRGLVGK
jgi:hypothetical protein